MQHNSSLYTIVNNEHMIFSNISFSVYFLKILLFCTLRNFLLQFFFC